MDIELEQLHKSIIEIRQYLKSDIATDSYLRLVNNFNKFVGELQNHFNHTPDPWFDDGDFMKLFTLWLQALGSPLNESRQKAAVMDLRLETKNDIEIAKKVLLNAAKYGTAKFSESIKNIDISKPKKTDAKQAETTDKSIDINDIIAQYQTVKLIERTKSQLRLCGSLKPFELSRIIKLTGLNVVLNE